MWRFSGLACEMILVRPTGFLFSGRRPTGLGGFGFFFQWSAQRVWRGFVFQWFAQRVWRGFVFQWSAQRVWGGFVFQWFAQRESALEVVSSVFVSGGRGPVSFRGCEGGMEASQLWSLVVVLLSVFFWGRRGPVSFRGCEGEGG